MPRMKEITDYFSSPEGEEEHHEYLIDVPPQDWCTGIHIDLQPGEFVQLKKVDGVWKLATSLTEVLTAQKKGRKTSEKKN